MFFSSFFHHINPRPYRSALAEFSHKQQGSEMLVETKQIFLFCKRSSVWQTRWLPWLLGAQNPFLLVCCPYSMAIILEDTLWSKTTGTPAILPHIRKEAVERERAKKFLALVLLPFKKPFWKSHPTVFTYVSLATIKLEGHQIAGESGKCRFFNWAHCHAK